MLTHLRTPLRMAVRGLVMTVAAAPLVAQAPAAGPVPSPRAIGTMSELMVRVIYPASDALFYIESRTPTTEEQWGQLEGTTLMLAESANLLMSPQRAIDSDQWMRDSALLLDVAADAFEAAKDKDVNAIVELSDRLYESCTSCHRHYRPDYGRRP